MQHWSFWILVCQYTFLTIAICRTTKTFHRKLRIQQNIFLYVFSLSQINEGTGGEEEEEDARNSSMEEKAREAALEEEEDRV